MDEPSPPAETGTSPPDPPPGAPAGPEPPPRLWRGQGDTAANRRRARRRAWAWLLTLAGVSVLSLLLLASWVRPAPTLRFVPAWAPGLADVTRALATAPEAERDLAAVTDPKRNALGRSVPAGFDPRGRALDDLVATAAELGSEGVRVVYVNARAVALPEAEGAGSGSRGSFRAWVLPNDDDDPVASRDDLVPLHRLIERTQGRGSPKTLLLLDLHPAQADPRLGPTGGDLASAVRDEVAAAAGPDLLVVASCDAGETPLTSAALGRSAFGFYVEEGLRGWADRAPAGTATDGRVSALELATYVRERVGRWARRARGATQSPRVVPEAGLDFHLLALPRGRAGAPLTLPEEKAVPSYPTWLTEAWGVRDRWRAEGHAFDAPRATAQLEAVLLAAERNWRNGAAEAGLRTGVSDALRRLTARLEVVRTLPDPGAQSLAVEEALGHTPDPALGAAVVALAVKRGTPAPDARPAEVEAADARLVAEFYAGLKGKVTDADLAGAVFRAAADEPRPTRDGLRFLDRLLTARQSRPLFAETDALHWVASLPAEGWDAEVAHLALDVARRGERAAGRPGAFATVRPLLDAADRSRHEAEALLKSPGFAPAAEAARRLREASAALTELLAVEDGVDQVRHDADDALALLPAALPLLDAVPELAPTWEEALTAAREVLGALAGPPPADAAAARAGAAALVAAGRRLRAPLDRLKEAASPARVAFLAGPDRAPTPAALAEVEALLATPLPSAPARAALWTLLNRVDRSLNAEVLRLDHADGRVLPSGPAEDGESARAAARARDRDASRARRSAALLTLADPPSARGPDLRLAWSGLTGKALAEADPFAADRMLRLVPPLPESPALDGPDAAVARRLRVARLGGLIAWRAARHAFEARDLDGSPFDAGAADALAAAAPPVKPPLTLASGPSSAVPTLDPEHPTAVVPFRLQLDPGAKEVTAQVEVVTADPDWLDIGRGTPWPDGVSERPAVERSPLAFPVKLTPGEPVELPLEVRLRPEPTDPRREAPVPKGFLVRVRAADRTYHARVRLKVIPESQRLRVVLGRDTARPSSPLGELRLRTVPTPTDVFLHVENPSDADRSVLVQLLDGDAPVPGCEVPVAVKSRGFTKVLFGQPAAKPETDVVPVRGPLKVRLLDAADPKTVVAERTVPVGVAPATDVVRVVAARYEPAGEENGGKARFSVRVRAVGDPGGPPREVDLVLSPDRIPGLRSAGEGSFHATLAKPGDEALLVAEGLQLDAREDEEGFADLTVDGAERAFILRTVFSRQGEPTTPRAEHRPAVRILAPASAYNGAPFDARLALDAPPRGGTLDLTLGRFVGRAFVTDLHQVLPATREFLRLNPKGPAGALRFTAEVRDPVVPLDVRRLRGSRTLEVSLNDAEGGERASDTLAVLFDDRPPAGVKLVEVPRYALKGAPLTLKAVGSPPGAGVRRVLMFLGRPADGGKLPPNTNPVEARPLDASRTAWSAKLPVPDDKKGPTEVSVLFESGVGLSASDTATVQVVDKVPVEPGGVRGTVVEGRRPQAGLAVVLVDAKGTAALAQAKADDDGKFEFPNLPPGNYQVVAVKPTPRTRGVAPAKVAAGAVTEVTVEMRRLP